MRFIDRPMTCRVPHTRHTLGTAWHRLLKKRKAEQGFGKYSKFTAREHENVSYQTDSPFAYSPSQSPGFVHDRHQHCDSSSPTSSEYKTLHSSPPTTSSYILLYSQKNASIMRITTPLLTALLAPSVALAYHCTQFKAVYRLKTENPTGFKENTDQFKQWASKNGGGCGGGCWKPKKVGNVYEMVCWAPRFNKVTTGIPHAADGTEILQPLERGCDTHCKGDCEFTWKCCHFMDSHCWKPLSAGW